MTVLEVGTSKQLLFDDAFTESKEGFVTTMNPAVRTEKPVLLPEKPWETLLTAWITVIEDEGIYKMWYSAFGEDNLWRILYATSKDGVNWVRLSLGVIEYRGSKENNIVFRGTPDLENVDRSKLPGDGPFHPGTIFKDTNPNAEPEKRFKSIHGIRRPPPEPGYVIYQVTGAYSPDGIHWALCKKEPIMPWYTDTQNSCFWDDHVGKYVAYVRWYKNWEYFGNGKIKTVGEHDVRAIGRSESEDFENFPAPEMIMEPDNQDTPDTDIYNNAAVKYPYAADSYFMFPSVFHHKEDTLDVQLATSRDGVHFTRWREPFLRLGPPGAFDSMTIYMAVGMLLVGDELWMYYGGSRIGHNAPEYWKRMRPNKNTMIPLTQSHDWENRGIGRARIRLDGFVSQDAPRSGGNLVTVPLRFAGKRLEVNVNGGDSGWLKVEILDKNNEPIPGFSEEEADELWGDNVRKLVTWKGGSDLSKLRQQTIRLHFLGQSVKLYAFQFPV